MEIAKLKKIEINDGHQFRYNNDVMRCCFNGSETAQFGQYATREAGDGCLVWFPKERRLKNGEWKSGSSEVNWKNYLDEDGEIIVSELNPSEEVKPGVNEPDDETNTRPMYTFFQGEDDTYRYVGTFVYDIRSSAPRKRIYRRIETYIDLSPWYEGLNLSYIQSGGNDALNNVYIDGSFERQVLKIKEFEEHISDYNSIEETYLSVVSLMNRKYSLAKFRLIDEKGFEVFISDCIKAVNNVTGRILEFDNLWNKEKAFPEVAWPYVDIINSTSIGNTIADSELGDNVAGAVGALFDSDAYIYSLSEEETCFFLAQFGIDTDKIDSLTDKHNRLYFLKQCNVSMDEWTPYIFIRFLEFVFGNPYKKLSTAQQINKDENLINLNTLKAAIRWFVYKSYRMQKNSDISFDSGWLKDNEGYKEEIYRNARAALDCEKWDESMVGSGSILSCVIAAMNAKSDSGFNNIVDFHGITHIKEVASGNILEAERILYHIYMDSDDELWFGKACELWGRRFPELSYLFFLKDKSLYVPVKTTHHSDLFKKLNIDTKCFGECNWGNYKEYLLINEEIRANIENELGIRASLLDAHSFIWMLKLAPNDFAVDEDESIEQLISVSNPYETVTISEGKEGKKIAYFGTKYERNPKNRMAAIKIHGYSCVACGFDFEKTYGEIGREFIEVHHVKPLHSLDEEMTINPYTDLTCLCANCHRMIHRRRGAIMSIDELRETIELYRQ